MISHVRCLLLPCRLICLYRRDQDSDADVGKLIEKTETEGDQEEVEKKDGLSFAFAKIWTAEKDTLEEMPDDITEGNDVDDSWTQTLAVSNGPFPMTIFLFDDIAAHSC